jgi:ribulose-phosphate 3-epimerase
MLKCSASLWSADLANLAAEIRRVEPHCERFHLDVADGHHTTTLLFFPDLVKAIRKHTRHPFEVHLMTTDPQEWIEPFMEAGANIFIFCRDTTRDPAGLLKTVHSLGGQAGFSLTIPEPLERLDDCWEELDLLTIIGTAVGVKGASMDPSIPDKIRRAREFMARRGVQTEIEADGGIRRETVPLLKAAGADWIVPGSLMFNNDPAEMRRWLASLG